MIPKTTSWAIGNFLWSWLFWSWIKKKSKCLHNSLENVVTTWMESIKAFFSVSGGSLLTRYLRARHHHSPFVTAHFRPTWTLHRGTSGMCKYLSPAWPKPILDPNHINLFLYEKAVYIYCQKSLISSYTSCYAVRFPWHAIGIIIMKDKLGVFAGGDIDVCTHLCMYECIGQGRLPQLLFYLRLLDNLYWAWNSQTGRLAEPQPLQPLPPQNWDYRYILTNNLYMSAGAKFGCSYL